MYLILYRLFFLYLCYNVLFTSAVAQSFSVRLGTGLQNTYPAPIKALGILEDWSDIKLNRTNHDYVLGTIGWDVNRFLRVETVHSWSQMQTPNTQYQFGLNLQGRIPLRTTRLYLQSGIVADQARTFSAISIGGGFEASFTRHTSLFIEAQHLIKAPQLAQIRAGNYNDVSQIQGGVIVHIRRKKRPKTELPKPETLPEPLIVEVSRTSETQLIATKTEAIPEIHPQPFQAKPFSIFPPTTIFEIAKVAKTEAVNTAEIKTTEVKTTEVIPTQSENRTNSETKRIPETRRETPAPTRSNTPLIQKIEAKSEGEINMPLLFKVNLEGTRTQTRQTKIFWNFGDGTIKEGNSIRHAFQEPNFYEVFAVAQNAFGADTLSTTIWIKPDAEYLASCKSPMIERIVIPSVLIENTPYIFSTETNEAENKRYFWLFDHTLQSSEIAPSLSFTAGKHEVSLRVSNACGETHKTMSFEVISRVNPICQNINTLRPVFFVREGMELSAVAQNTLDLNLDALLQCEQVCVQVQGYAERGETIAQRSRQRAENVANYYISRGLPQAQILPIKMQERTDTLCNNQDARGCRRVESWIVPCLR